MVCNWRGLRFLCCGVVPGRLGLRVCRNEKRFADGRRIWRGPGWMGSGFVGAVL